jgi:ferredoxin-NADP reductase
LVDHSFSSPLAALKVRDKIQFNGPFGRLTFQGGQANIGMLSGGIGITPLLPLIKYAADKGLDLDIVLLCPNRSEEDVALRAALKDLQSRNPKFRIIEDHHHA